jgi:hypothetical protein
LILQQHAIEAALETAFILSQLAETGWRPHNAQEAILQRVFRDLARVTFVECGRKFGKTEVQCYFLWRNAMMRPGGHYYFAPEQKQAKEIVWASGRLQAFGPQSWIKSVNNSEMRITLINGSFIKVDGSDNFNSYRGIEPHSAVYDEFRDFRPEFHKAFGPNLMVYNAPLLICGTPPEEQDLPHYDGLLAQAEVSGTYFNFPSWCNPHISREWLREERDALYARGDGDVWEREYAAKRVFGGANAVFPMFTATGPLSMVKPHADVIEAIWKDRKKLMWQVVADPGTSSCFAVLFRAINPFTKVVYRLDEIYETDQANTSTGIIIPRIRAKTEELFPGHEAYGVDWDYFYDEAAAWFANESAASFDIAWHPTRKALRDKVTGIGLMKDQMLYGKYVVSDRCKKLKWEITGYRKDAKGKIPKKNDHLLDCDRYGNDFCGVDLTPEREPARIDPEDSRRFTSIQHDLSRHRAEQGEVDLDLVEDF